MRKITSLTAALSFIIVVLTSIVLYIVPQGRVAYWADWRLWGLSKTDWGNIHINTGLLFFIALFLHIYYNWKPLMAYLKNRTRQFRLFTRQFNIALTITLFCTVGSYFLWPPFNWVMAFNDHLKTQAAIQYGEPPYGHAELSSLRSFTQKTGLDLNKSMVLLRQAGYAIENADATLAQISRQYGVPPQQIFQAMQPATFAPTDQPAPFTGALPPTPPTGTGNLTLADLCAQHHLALEQVMKKLTDAGLKAEPNATLKKIAGDNQLSPLDLYARIRAVSEHP